MGSFNFLCLYFLHQARRGLWLSNERILGCLLWCMASNPAGVIGLLLLSVRGCLKNLTVWFCCFLFAVIIIFGMNRAVARAFKDSKVLAVVLGSVPTRVAVVLFLMIRGACKI